MPIESDHARRSYLDRRPGVDVVADEIVRGQRRYGESVASELLSQASRLYGAYVDAGKSSNIEALGWEQLSAIEVRRWVAVARAADGL